MIRHRMPMHERLGLRSRQDTVPWILDSLFQPWLEGQIDLPNHDRR